MRELFFGRTLSLGMKIRRNEHKAVALFAMALLFSMFFTDHFYSWLRLI